MNDEDIFTATLPAPGVQTCLSDVQGLVREKYGIGTRAERLTGEWTMGKPMGNGHPVAAVLSRPEPMAEFARQNRYFNTFGGNTVACEVALAVLDTLEREKLIDHARDVGGHLQQGLRRLAQLYPAIGEVRGTGLFVGVQMQSRELAARVVNGLRAQGVLIGSSGADADSLKIRPPLIITHAEVDMMLEALQRVLQAEKVDAK